MTKLRGAGPKFSRTTLRSKWESEEDYENGDLSESSSEDQIEDED